MGDAILVLNAGSSSLKFTEFVIAGDALETKISGTLEELYGRARFRARAKEAVSRTAAPGRPRNRVAPLTGANAAPAQGPPAGRSCAPLS